MPRKHRVIIADFINDDLPIEHEILGDVATIEALDMKGEDDMIGRVEDADAIMIYHCIPMRRKIIERLKQCRVIVRCGVGFDNVDFEFARSVGIPVANVPDYGTEEVADSAIGLTLAMTRGITQQNVLNRAGAGNWMFDDVAPLRRLRGRVFAIVGLGRIGSAAALRAQALGMDVVFYDPYKSDGYDKSLGVRRVETLDELLEQAFVVSVHCPMTPETTKLINAETIDKMPRGGYVVNTARGGIVDTSAIAPAIASGQLAGAGLDVLPEEPPRDDDPLIVAWRDPAHPAHTRLIINPHGAFYSEEGLRDMRIKGSQNCRRALVGEPLRNVVN